MAVKGNIAKTAGDLSYGLKIDHKVSCRFLLCIHKYYFHAYFHHE